VEQDSCYIVGLIYGVESHIQQYFSFIVAVSFIGCLNHEYPEKTTDLLQDNSLLSSTHYLQ
jgi:hypothetical protein